MSTYHQTDHRVDGPRPVAGPPGPVAGPAMPVDQPGPPPGGGAWAASPDQTYDGLLAPVADPAYSSGGERGEQARFSEDRQRERYGGLNWGAGFFGSVVLVGVAAILLALAGVAATVLRMVTGAETLGEAVAPVDVALVVAAAFFAVVLTASYAGGYVAGRMSRFDGGRQGVGVWVFAVLLGGFTVGLGLFLTAEYDLLSRLDLPALPGGTALNSLSGVVAAVAAMLSSLFAALAGGSVGCRYHRKVDDAGYL